MNGLRLAVVLTVVLTSERPEHKTCCSLSAGNGRGAEPEQRGNLSLCKCFQTSFTQGEFMETQQDFGREVKVKDGFWPPWWICNRQQWTSVLRRPSSERITFQWADCTNSRGWISEQSVSEQGPGFTMLHVLWCFHRWDQTHSALIWSLF